MTTTAVDIFDEFAVDETKALEGTWVPYKSGVEFLIAKSGNKRFRRKAAALMAKNKRILDQKDGDGVSTDAAEDKFTDVMVEVLSDTVLLGWRGPLTFKGEVLKYSKDNAKKMLRVEKFRELVSDLAADEASFKVAEDAEAEKN